jgi:hypothetical protein
VKHDNIYNVIKNNSGDIKMKITKSRLKEIIKEELQVTLTNEEAGDMFGEEVQLELDSQEEPLGESIDVRTIDNLEAAIKEAYEELTTGTDIDQTYADTGEPVSKDPTVMHQKAVELIMQVVSDVTGDPRFQSNGLGDNLQEQ